MKKYVTTGLALAFWLLVWQLLSLQVGLPLLLPAPGKVALRLFELVQTDTFWSSTFLSLLRVVSGIFWGAALGLLLGIACRNGILDALIRPLMTVVKSTPVASVTILVLLWLDRDTVPVLIAGMMVLPAVWAGICAGISQTDPQLLEMSAAYGFSPAKKLLHIYIPSVLPYFRAACGSALGLAWKAGIAAEVLAVPARSMGKMIFESKLYFMTEDLFAWTLAVILLSLLVEKLLMTLLSGGKRHA